MGKNAEISITWKGKSHAVDVHLPLIIFEDSGSQIVYFPALDVSGHGKTEDEACKIYPGEFSRYTLNKKHLSQGITKAGLEAENKQNKTNDSTRYDCFVK